MSRIIVLNIDYYKIPLEEIVAGAKYSIHTHSELITVKITTSDGHVGTGYTCTGRFGGRAIYKLIETELKNAILGLDSDEIGHIYEEPNRTVHHVGHGGVIDLELHY